MRDELEARGEEVRVEAGMLLASDGGGGGEDFGGDCLYLGAELVGAYRVEDNTVDSDAEGAERKTEIGAHLLLCRRSTVGRQSDQPHGRLEPLWNIALLDRRALSVLGLGILTAAVRLVVWYSARTSE